jgi:hypothetical protein
MQRRPQKSKSRGKRAPEAHAKKAIPIDDTAAEAITEQKRLFRESSDAHLDQTIRSSLIPIPQSPNFSVLKSQEETWRALVQAAAESEMDPHWSTR